MIFQIVLFHIAAPRPEFNYILKHKKKESGHCSDFSPRRTQLAVEDIRSNRNFLKKKLCFQKESSLRHRITVCNGNRT